MNEILLIAVIALAVALLSMLINLMLVWKISELKSHMKWIEEGPIDRLKIQLTTTNSQIDKLEADVMDAFGKLTNHLTRHDDEIDRVVKKYGEMEHRVSKHTKQLEDLGNFAGITTGELRVLEQKIYNASKPRELSEPEPLTREIEEVKNRVKNRLEMLESKLLDILKE